MSPCELAGLLLASLLLYIPIALLEDRLVEEYEPAESPAEEVTVSTSPK